MNRRWLAALVAACLLGLEAAAVDLPEKWRSWRYSRELTPRSSAEQDAPAAELTVPWEIFARCAPGCADLRIIDDSGIDVPFVLMNGRGYQRAASSQHSARLVENSFVSNQYTQVIGDLGEGLVSFDQVTVHTNRADFLAWVEVALSDEGRTWRVVEPRAPIARFRSRSIEGSQTISIHGLSSRYVRVRISDTSAKFPVDDLMVSSQAQYDIKAAEVPADFSEQQAAPPGESVYRATLTSPNQPHSEVRIQTESPEFYRGVRISGSNDGQEWSYFGSGFVYRYKQGDKVRELLTVEYPEMSGYRLVRVEVTNGDDQPLRNVKLSCAAFSRVILFQYSAGKRYRLLYGNDKAVRAQYDLANYFRTSPEGPSNVVFAALAEEITGNYRDPRPFTERHPGVLWLALGAAILLIGFTAIKTLRAPVKHADQT